MARCSLPRPRSHAREWSVALSTKGSARTCIPDGVSTFLHAVFTAHGGEAIGAVGSSAMLERLVVDGHILTVVFDLLHELPTLTLKDTVGCARAAVNA